MFLNTWDAPERSYVKQLARQLIVSGRYDRYVETCSGSFVMPLVWHEAGWSPQQTECSDVSLYSAINGYVLSDQSLKDLGMSIDGKALKLEGDTPVEQAAFMLYSQLVVRMEARPDVEYWRDIRRDLTERRDVHLRAIAEKLDNLYERIGGLKFAAEDMWTHQARVMDDPRTVVNTNPPTYKGGFERFYDTKGRLTWNEPEYEIFDPETGIDRMVEEYADAKGLILWLQQQEPGACSHERPVYARHLSPGQYVYYGANRPDEVFELMGGPQVALRRYRDLRALEQPMIPIDYEVTPKSEIHVEAIPADAVGYYKHVWLHRIKSSDASLNFVVFIDGLVAGIGGYSTSTMTTPYNDKYRDALIMNFAIGAPHDKLRLTRLVTKVALQRGTLETIASKRSGIYVAMAKRLVTSEYSPHPEAKGLRGLMKLQDRVKDKQGFKLVYAADLEDLGPKAAMRYWLEKEAAWQRKTTKIPA